MATECGCLQPSAKKIIGEVLDTYLEVIKDDDLKSNVEQIKSEIERCSCKVNKPEPEEKKEKEKTKRAPSERNVFMGNCMRSKEKGGEGKPMGECSTKWKEEKKK